MGKAVGIRELKNNASRIVEQVEAGETITITRRGKPVATMVSGDVPPGLAAMIADGTARPPEVAPGTWPSRSSFADQARRPPSTYPKGVAESLPRYERLVKLLIDEPESELAHEAYDKASRTATSAVA